MRGVVAAAFALILFSLGSALFYMMRDRSATKRTVRALTVRIGASVVLFISILVAHRLGWIEFTGIR